MSEIPGNSYKWPELLEMADIDSKWLEMFSDFHILFSQDTQYSLLSRQLYKKKPVQLLLCF